MWEVDATTNAVLELGGHLVRRDREGHPGVHVRLLADLVLLAGGRRLHVQLVNARDIKNAPGRPNDAQRLAAKLTERGMLRPSFVPPAEIRQLRDYTRLRTDLTRERTRCLQRLEKLRKTR